MLGIVLIDLLPSWKDWMFESSWTFQDEAGGVLGLTWVNKENREQKRRADIHSTLVECISGKVLYSGIYHSESILVKDIHLWLGDKYRWMWTWQEFPLTEEAGWTTFLSSVPLNASSLSVPTAINGQYEDEMFVMGSIVSVIVLDEKTLLVYLKPSVDDIEPSLVCVGQILKNNDGEQIKEDIIDTGLMTSMLIMGDNRHFIIFDADWKVHEWVKVNNMGLGGIRPETSGLWLSELNALQEKSSSKIIDGAFKGNPFWRFRVSSGQLLSVNSEWTVWLDISVPAHTHPYAHFDDDVIAGAVLIPGPRWQQQHESQSTIIVAVGIIKKEAIGLPDEQARPLRGGELLCLSETGQVVQECKEEIVEQVELCLVGDAVIGVDRIRRRWRLWRWEPLAGKEQFTTVRWLDEEVVHAHVVTNHDNSDPQGTQCWLVEERPKGLRVSRCAGQTLAETEPPLDLPGWSLPAPLERSVGHWDWPVKKGIIGHDDALLLIAADEQSRMVLYRVEAGDKI